MTLTIRPSSARTPFDEGLGHLRGDVGRRLDIALSDDQNVGDGIDHQSHHLAADLGDDDDMTCRRLRGRKAEPHSEIDDRQDRAAQIDDTADIGWRMRQRRRRSPAAQVAHRHDVDTELLRSQPEGDQFTRVVGSDEVFHGHYSAAASIGF